MCSSNCSGHWSPHCVRRRPSFSHSPFKSFLSSIWMRLGLEVVTRQKALHFRNTVWVVTLFQVALLSYDGPWNKVLVIAKLSVGPRRVRIHSLLPPFLHALIYFISVDRVPATCVALQQMLDILRWGNGCGPALGRLCAGDRKSLNYNL